METMRFGLFWLICLYSVLICNGVFAPRSSFARISKIRGGATVRQKGNRKNHPPRRYSDTRYGPREEDAYGSNDGYPGDDGDYPYDDIVSSYMQGSSGKAMVAASAAVTAGFLAHFVQSFLIGKVFWLAIYITAAVGATFVFMRGDWAEFFRALGVFTIVLIQRASIKSYVIRLTSQLKALFMLADRRPFPPERGSEEEDSVSYNLINTMICLLLLGSMFGWNLSKPVPLFPNWLGGIIGAAVLTYGSTFGDSKGDFIRFAGYSLTALIGTLMQTANEVELRDRTGVVLGQTLFFLNGIDEQFQVRKRLSALVGELVTKGVGVMYSMRGTGGNNDNAGNKNNRNKNQGSSSRRSSEYDDDDEGYYHPPEPSGGPYYEPGAPPVAGGGYDDAYGAPPPAGSRYPTAAERKRRGKR